MNKIRNIAHVAGGLDEAVTFYDNVVQNANDFQNKGLEVEIQYGQSNNLFSALIIGREPVANANNITLNIESVNADVKKLISEIEKINNRSKR